MSNITTLPAVTSPKTPNPIKTNPVIVQEVKGLWFKGYSAESIAKLPNVTVTAVTINKWVAQYGWKDQVLEISKKADEKLEGVLMERFSDATMSHLDILDGLRDQVKHLAKFEDLDPIMLLKLAEANDRILTTQKRLIDHTEKNQIDGNVTEMTQILRQVRHIQNTDE